MPVPIAEIPNAPQIGNGPVLSGVPNVNTNISGVAKQLNITPLQQGAFDAPAQGAQAIGYNLGKLGEQGSRISSILADANERKQYFQDEVTLATIGRRRAEEFAKYQGTTQEKPESQWQPDWQKNFSEIDSKLGADLPPLSARGQQRLAVDTQEFLARTNTTLISSSTRSAVQRGAGELAAQAQRQFDSKDDEGGRATVSKLVTTGAWGQDQADKYLKQVDYTKNQNQLTAAMQQNPKMFLEDIQDFIKTGKSDVLDGNFKGPDKAIQLERWKGIAESNLRSIQSEQRQSLFEGISSGEISNENQILSTAKDGGDVLDAKDIQAARKALMNQVGPLDPAKYASIRTRVASYDPKADKAGEVGADLQREIASELPTAESQMLSRQLKGLMKEGTTPRSDVDSLFKTQAKDLYEKGIFGSFLTDAKARELTGSKAEENRQNEAKAAEKLSRLFDAWDQYHKANPDASFEDATKWLYQQTKPELQTKKGWFDWVKNPFASPALPPAKDRLEILKQKPAPGNKTSQAGGIDENLVSKVKEMEGFNPNAFSDYKQTSVGYGTRAKSPTEKIDEKEADARLRSELSMHASRVDESIKKSGLQLTDNQRSALISFDFNTGEADKLIETSKSADEIAARLPSWNKTTERGKKTVNQGLVNRRKAEMELFNS